MSVVLVQSLTPGQGSTSTLLAKQAGSQEIKDVRRMAETRSGHFRLDSWWVLSPGPGISVTRCSLTGGGASADGGSLSLGLPDI